MENSIESENGSFSSQDGSSVAIGPLSVAFGFVTRLASDLFARGRRHLDGPSNSDAPRHFKRLQDTRGVKKMPRMHTLFGGVFMLATHW